MEQTVTLVVWSVVLVMLIIFLFYFLPDLPFKVFFIFMSRVEFVNAICILNRLRQQIFGFP